MKILFICRENIGSSQVAEAFFNNLTKKHEASSAGTKVQNEGSSLATLRSANVIVQCMKDKGANIASSTVKSVNSVSLKKADIIIIMAEPETWPKDIYSYSKVIRWHVDDLKGKEYEEIDMTIEQIEKLVEKLIEEMG